MLGGRAEKQYVALMLDEMSVRGDLVYDHRAGSVVGFVNPETWNFKAVRFKDYVHYCDFCL